MNYTPNLKLKKPLQEEYYDVDDFNYNADILDKYISEGMYANQSLYVNGTTGNDDNEGTESSPFLTIQKAVNTTLKLGDICLINVSAGTYPEDVLIPRLTAKYLEIRGAGDTTIVKSFTVNGCNGQYTRLLSLKVNGLNSSNVAISSGNGYLQVDSVTLAGSGTGYGITVSGGGFISNGFTVGGYNIGVQVAYGAVANLRSITFGTNTTDIHAYGGMVMTNSTTTKTNATYGGYIVNLKTATSLTTGVADKDTDKDDSSKKLALTEWVNNQVVASNFSGDSKYIRFANGFTIMWINTTFLAANTQLVIDLPLAMTAYFGATVCAGYTYSNFSLKQAVNLGLEYNSNTKLVLSNISNYGASPTTVIVFAMT